MNDRKLNNIKDTDKYKDIMELLVEAGISKGLIKTVKVEDFTTIETPYINMMALDSSNKKTIDIATIKKYLDLMEDPKSIDLCCTYVKTKDNDLVVITKDFFKVLMVLYIAFSNLSIEEQLEYEDIQENPIPTSMTKGRRRTKKL